MYTIQLKAFTVTNYVKLGKAENKNHMLLIRWWLWFIKFTLADLEDKNTFCSVHIYLLGQNLIAGEFIMTWFVNLLLMPSWKYTVMYILHIINNYILFLYIFIFLSIICIYVFWILTRIKYRINIYLVRNPTANSVNFKHHMARNFSCLEVCFVTVAFSKRYICMWMQLKWVLKWLPPLLP